MNLIECFGFFHRFDSLGHSRPKNSHIGVRYMAAVVSPFVHSFTRKSSSRLQFTNFWVNITVWTAKLWSWLSFNSTLERKIFVGVEVLPSFFGFVLGLFWRIYCPFGNPDDASIWGRRSGSRICPKGTFWALCSEHHGWRVPRSNFHFHASRRRARIFLHFSLSARDFSSCSDHFPFTSNLVPTCSRGVDYLAVVLHSGHNLWDDLLELVPHRREKVPLAARHIHYHACVYIRDRWYSDCGPDWLAHRTFAPRALYSLFWK